ncbi:MAG: DedA family protein [Alphaproteobacteria bacterium]|jgi:membrane protein YqaA with SNARE-associated domain|nr:DedA family protein [Alphaproteobacteria bacterium]
MDLLALFLAALVAATLLPAQSEIVLAALVLADAHPVWLLLAVATAGNVLGSCVNYAIGRFLMRFAAHRRFPFRLEQVDRAQGWYARYGWVSLFLAWAPIIGDPLTLAAGILRERIWRFLLVVTLGKAARYMVLVAAVQAAG